MKATIRLPYGRRFFELSVCFMGGSYRKPIEICMNTIDTTRYNILYDGMSIVRFFAAVLG